MFASAVLAAPSNVGVIAAAGYTSVLIAWAVLMAGAMTVVAMVAAAAWRNSRRSNRRSAHLEVDVWQSGPPADSALAHADPVTVPRQRQPPRPPTPADCARLRLEAEELAAVAAAADAAARRAVAAEAEARARYLHTQQAREAAWQAIESAQQAHESAQRSTLGPGAARQGEGDVEREVTRAAYGAYRRGDISIDQLQEVLRRASGWDPQQEQHEHRVTQLRARERAARRRYYAFAAAERSARKAADIAAVAAQALVDEAAAAAAEARTARQLADECTARTAGRGRPARPHR